MGVKNKVIAGDYINAPVCCTFGVVSICPNLQTTINVDKTNVSSYELVTDEHRKSASSGIARGLVGGALLGPVGLLAGGLSAKNKGTYNVIVEFKDGKRSLIEIDDKRYKALVKLMF